MLTWFLMKKKRVTTVCRSQPRRNSATNRGERKSTPKEERKMRSSLEREHNSKKDTKEQNPTFFPLLSVAARRRWHPEPPETRREKRREEWLEWTDRITQTPTKQPTWFLKFLMERWREMIEEKNGEGERWWERPIWCCRNGGGVESCHRKRRRPCLVCGFYYMGCVSYTGNYHNVLF